MSVAACLLIERCAEVQVPRTEGSDVSWAVASGRRDKPEPTVVPDKAHRKSNLLDDLSWSQIKVVLNDGQELLLLQVRRAVVEDCDRERFGDADGVADLDQAATADSGLDQGLGDPASCVCGRSVDFCEILA